MTNPAPPTPPPGEKRSLRDLLKSGPKKTPVTVSTGTVYVRQIPLDELLGSEQEPSADVGRRLLSIIVGPNEDRKDMASLEPSAFDALTEADHAALAAVAAKQLQKDLPSGEPLSALGTVLKQYQQDREAKDRDFAKLTATSPVLKEIDEAKKQVDRLGVLPEFERMKSAYGQSVLGEIQQHMSSMNAARSALSALSPPKSRPIEIEPIKFPSVHETPAGRAALAAEETAEHVAKVADLTATMVSDMSKLTESVVQKALPEWNTQQKKAQEDANRSFQQAVFALIASVLVTILVAWWQVAVTKNLAAETAAQQVDSNKEQTKRHEDTLKALQAQVTAQRELIEQQHKVSESLRTALAGLKPPPATAQER